MNEEIIRERRDMDSLPDPRRESIMRTSCVECGETILKHAIKYEGCHYHAKCLVLLGRKQERAANPTPFQPFTNPYPFTVPANPTLIGGSWIGDGTNNIIYTSGGFSAESSSGGGGGGGVVTTGHTHSTPLSWRLVTSVA